MASRKIDDLIPQMRDKAQQFIDKCKSVGLSVILTCTARNIKEQIALYTQGRKSLEEVNKLRKEAGLYLISDDENKRKVTWTLNSNHIINLDDNEKDNDLAKAFDFVIIKDGKATYNVKESINNNDIPDYEECGRIGEKIGLKWGGRFKDSKGNPTPDYVHFEYDENSVVKEENSISKKGNISIFGCGYVGQALYHGLSPYFSIKIYDKFKKGYDTLIDTINHSKVIFVSVPTPVKNNGSQYLSDLVNSVSAIDQVSSERKIIVVRSTVLPGTMEMLKNTFPNQGFVFNPEFLTERTYVNDFINSNRIILGSDNEEDMKIVEDIYRVRFPQTKIFKVKPKEAEIVKYVCNCFFAVKVSFMNEIKEICDKIGIDFNIVKDMFIADQRVGNSHTEVPGFDGFKGFGGKCLPKDLKSFINFGNEILKLPMNTFKSADEVNERVREKKDWLDIVGATSENNYKE